MRILCGLSMLFLLTFAIAGPNQDAELFIDFLPASDTIDSVGACPVESTITTAVMVHGASGLYSYEFYVQFDTASLQFVSGKSGNDQNTTMLAKNGGSPVFNAKKARYDSTRILVTCYLTGDVSSECVSDKGVLGMLTFKLKKDDTTTLSFVAPKLIDCSEREDTAMDCFSGTIMPSTGVPVVFHPVRKNASAPIVAVRNGTINIDFNQKTDFVLTAVNTLGKRLFSNKGCSNKISFGNRNIGSASKYGGLIVVRICYSGNELVIPLIQ